MPWAGTSNPGSAFSLSYLVGEAVPQLDSGDLGVSSRSADWWRRLFDLILGATSDTEPVPGTEAVIKSFTERLSLSHRPVFTTSPHLPDNACIDSSVACLADPVPGDSAAELAGRPARFSWLWCGGLAVLGLFGKRTMETRSVADRKTVMPARRLCGGRGRGQ
jgi:hypothetical protein